MWRRKRSVTLGRATWWYSGLLQASPIPSPRVQSWADAVMWKPLPNSSLAFWSCTAWRAPQNGHKAATVNLMALVARVDSAEWLLVNVTHSDVSPTDLPIVRVQADLGHCLWLLGQFYTGPAAFCLFMLLHFAEPWARPLPQPGKVASIRVQGWMLHLGESKVSETGTLPRVILQLWVGQHGLVWVSSPKGNLKHKTPSFLQHRPRACPQDALPLQAIAGRTPRHSENETPTRTLLCTVTSTLLDCYQDGYSQWLP